LAMQWLSRPPTAAPSNAAAAVLESTLNLRVKIIRLRPTG
jgi:hypothetical protein